MTHAIRVHATGGPEVLQWEVVEVGEPGPGQARIRHTAIGLNFIEVYHRIGFYPMPLPFTPGQEGAGVVEAVGAGVTHVKLGDRVAYGGTIGSYSERRLIAADKLLVLPDAIDDRSAAALTSKGLTAAVLLRRGFKVAGGHTVLFHAAAGGVGTIACQWAAALGATVIGTVGSDEKAAFARANGCHHAINYRSEDFVTRVNEITGGKGVDVVYDSVGKDTFPRSLECMKPFGFWIGYGQSSGRPPPFDMTLLQKRWLYVGRQALQPHIATRAGPGNAGCRSVRSHRRKTGPRRHRPGISARRGGRRPPRDREPFNHRKFGAHSMT